MFVKECHDTENYILPELDSLNYSTLSPNTTCWILLRICCTTSCSTNPQQVDNYLGLQQIQNQLQRVHKIESLQQIHLLMSWCWTSCSTACSMTCCATSRRQIEVVEFEHYSARRPCHLLVPDKHHHIVIKPELCSASLPTDCPSSQRFTFVLVLFCSRFIANYVPAEAMLQQLRETETSSLFLEAYILTAAALAICRSLVAGAVIVAALTI